MIAIDTETTLITHDEPVPRLVCVSFADDRGVRLYHVDTPGLPDVVRAALTVGAIFANAPFDILAILRQWPDLEPAVIAAYNGVRISDVLTREELFDIAEGKHYQRGGYGLAAVAERRIGLALQKSDTWRMRYGALLSVPIEAWPAEAVAYAKLDAVATYATWCAQARDIPARVLIDEAHQVASELPMYEQTCYGIPTDPVKVAALDARLAREIAELSLACVRNGLARVGGTKAAPKITRNTKAAMAAFEPFARRFTATGRVSLSEDALAEAAIPTGHPLDLYRRLGATTSLRTQRMPALRAPIVRTTYRRADTGRTTSSEPKLECWPGGNLQNQPKEGGFRECLVPPPGFKIGISDYGAQELVTLAQVQYDWFGQSALGDMLREGRDPHWEIGREFAGFGAVEYTGAPEHKAARQSGKAFNFGKPGRMGVHRHIAYALNSYGVRMTEDEARAYDRQWHDKFPEMRMFFDIVGCKDREASAQRGVVMDFEGFVTLVQPRSGRIRGRCRVPEACNSTFQGLASDVGRTALWWLWCACRDQTSPLYGSRVALFEHDAFATFMPADRAEAALAEQDRIMIAAAAAWCPDVPQKIESRIADCYQK